MLGKEKEIWVEILLLYKDLRCLWDVSHEDYLRRHTRHRAMERLVDKYKVIEDDMTVSLFKKKIDNMRTSYQREMRKVKESLRNASTQEEVYVPKLWYYDLLTFLDRDTPQSPSASQPLQNEMAIEIVDVKTATNFVDSEGEDVDRLSDHSSASPPHSQRKHTSARKRPRPRGTVENVQSKVTLQNPSRVKTATNFVESEGDDVEQLSDQSSVSPPESQRTTVSVRKRPKPREMVQTVQSNHAKRLYSKKGYSRNPSQRLKHSAFGEHVAEKLRSMPQTTAVFCQKIINDAIFMAEIDNLNATSRIVTNFQPGSAPSKR